MFSLSGLEGKDGGFQDQVHTREWQGGPRGGLADVNNVQLITLGWGVWRILSPDFVWDDTGAERSWLKTLEVRGHKVAAENHRDYHELDQAFFLKKSLEAVSWYHHKVTSAPALGCGDTSSFMLEELISCIWWAPPVILQRGFRYTAR